MMTEVRDANLDRVTPHVVHPGLHQDYELDFQLWRVDDIAPTLTSPTLAGIASSVRLIGRPAVPKVPAAPKIGEGLRGHGGAPAQPAVPGPSCVGGPVETEGEKPLEVGKHLDLQFVCGGCFSRSFLNGPALNKHMKACASVTVVRDHSKW